jgi:hypothetical protein
VKTILKNTCCNHSSDPDNVKCYPPGGAVNTGLDCKHTDKSFEECLNLCTRHDWCTQFDFGTPSTEHHGKCWLISGCMETNDASNPCYYYTRYILERSKIILT